VPKIVVNRKQPLLVQLTIEDVVTCFSGTQCT